jgi:hypothetical protein
MARQLIHGGLRATIPWLILLSCQVSHGQLAETGLPTILQNDGLEDGESGQIPPGWFMPTNCTQDGYSLRTSDDQPLVGKHCAVVSRNSREEPTSFGNMTQGISAEKYRGKRIRFRAAVRTELVDASNRAQLWFRVDRPNQQTGFFDNMGNRPITAKEWKHYEIVGDVAADAQMILVGMFLLGNGSAAVDDVTIPTTGLGRVLPGPGLTELRMAATIRPKGAATTTTYMYPLPLSYRDQVPLSFQLQVEPPGAAKSVEIVENAGENRVLKLALHRLDKHKEVKVRYSSVVLVGPTQFDGVPKTAEFPAEWPEDVRPWLQSTWCCDHEDERIKKLSAQVRGDVDDVMQVIANVMTTAKQTFAEAQGRAKNLTAVEALDKRGSCTSCANLVTALLRGSGVPARILAGYPLWSGPLQTHYIVEAYVPGFGWYPVESTRCVSPWPNHQQVNVSIVPVEHESQDKAGSRVTAAAAVPYLSLTELEDPKARVFSTGTLKPFSDHDWQEWLASTPRLEEGCIVFAVDGASVQAKTLGEVLTEFK